MLHMPNSMLLAASVKTYATLVEHINSITTIASTGSNYVGGSIASYRVTVSPSDGDGNAPIRMSGQLISSAVANENNPTYGYLSEWATTIRHTLPSIDIYNEIKAASRLVYCRISATSSASATNGSTRNGQSVAFQSWDSVTLIYTSISDLVIYWDEVLKKAYSFNPSTNSSPSVYDY